MTVYLLHFEKPLSSHHTAQHYIGWTEDLESRIARHRNGGGARFCEVAKQRGIDFQLARTWIGDRTLERQLKRRKSGRRLCPVCSPDVPHD
ncbi:MAG: endonuclease [Acaryochloris sp. RU_4_1]|nr:endonuclease [Acaryochloris sp. RU_4_1]NJR55659.1 endonuclease [Acaryochloris sp. CRU_2_0]